VRDATKMRCGSNENNEIKTVQTEIAKVETPKVEPTKIESAKVESTNLDDVKSVEKPKHKIKLIA